MAIAYKKLQIKDGPVNKKTFKNIKNYTGIFAMAISYFIHTVTFLRRSNKLRQCAGDY